MDNILNSYRNSNDAIAQMIARDFDEAFQVSRTKNWKEAKMYAASKNTQSGLQNDLIPHFEDIRIKLQLRGLPNEVAKFRTSKGIFRNKIGSRVTEGGTVAASKAEIVLNGKTYSTITVEGASINARTKSIDPVVRQSIRNNQINKRFIARNKQTKKPVNNDEAVDHAEQDNLGNLAREIDALIQPSGIAKKDIVGKVYMHVERSPCTQCTANIYNKSNKTEGPLYLFSKKYENLEIIITNDDFPGQILRIQNGNKIN